MPEHQQNDQDRDPEVTVVAAAQFAAGDDVDANLRCIESLTRSARARGAQLVVFPEAAMFSWNAPAADIAEAASRHSERFSAALCALAKRERVHLLAGAFVPGGGERPRNRILVIDADGVEQPGYDKVHLYDAFAARESDKVEPAPVNERHDELRTVALEGLTLGLVNCYDLRFPELTRALVDRGADVLVVSSAWVAGPLKEMHWQTLLRARAIENTAYVVASNQSPPGSVGLSMVVDPMGLTVSTCTAQTGIAVAELSRERIDQVREMLPSLRHRRF